MTVRPSIRRTVTALAVTGAAASAVVAGAGAASAMPTDFNCTSGQVDTTLVAGDPGAGQRYASVVFTAKPGDSCTLPGSLPVTLTGADGITVTTDPAAADAPPVTVADGAPASMLLHWTGIEAPENQVSPVSVTVTAPATTTPRGDTSDPAITLPWTQGAMDNSTEAHTLTVGPVTAGAPTT
ncbi:DUF4232 domain-containing protein [Amycolatopsis sp., V23-08]|uniref:DUF4232 domain-containing protein n=1 Tax=Amycolatopsis heterodermiae TaxID=3110235 RepID=A0ABU5R4B4_9PSEU|nr:DUF4232 domain-containing protein [Amycolatopsis sp., V23-08]MEA5360156.1 DUF4232 domain-containing protein [Amycolatopsis sp., V23-08]